MMNEELVKQILSLNPLVSREALLERLECEKRRTGGLISGETLLRIVAAEFGVGSSRAQKSLPTLSISKLIAGLYDATVIGRIVAIFPPRTFNGKRSGKLASVLIADWTGLLRVVMWNDQTSLIETGRMAVGQIIRLSHAYTKEDRNGKAELHIGAKCEIDVNPEGIHADAYPTIESFLTRINELANADRNVKVNVAGTVQTVFAASSFARQDSSQGRVMRFSLVDETGEIAVVVWNERVYELEKTLKPGIKFQIVNGRLKKAMGEGLEIHVNGDTYVEAVPVVESFMKIADLKAGQANANIQAEVATEPETRDVRTSKGEAVTLTTLELKDETSLVRLRAWRQHSDTARKLKPGTKVVIKNVYVKQGFGSHLELSTREATTITLTI